MNIELRKRCDTGSGVSNFGKSSFAKYFDETWPITNIICWTKVGEIRKVRVVLFINQKFKSSYYL